MPSKQGPRLFWRLSNLEHPNADLDQTVRDHLLNHSVQVLFPYERVDKELQEELDVQLVSMLPPDEGYQVRVKLGIPLAAPPSASARAACEWTLAPLPLSTCNRASVRVVSTGSTAHRVRQATRRAHPQTLCAPRPLPPAPPLLAPTPSNPNPSKPHDPLLQRSSALAWLTSWLLC